MRSNVACWQALQDADYFAQHPRYKGYPDHGDFDVRKIADFFGIEPHHTVVVIGCGYGRESAHICKRAAMVYGIDVSERILSKAVAYLRDTHGVTNFRPVLAETYATEIPPTIDLVYSMVVMQHLTRDLVRDYLKTLTRKLLPAGRMVIQFLQSDQAEQDAAIRIYEPCVSWTSDEIADACEAAGLRALGIETQAIKPGWLWHWAHIGRAA